MVKIYLSTTMKRKSWFTRIAYNIAATFMRVDLLTGTFNQLWASTAKDVISGTYYEPVGRAGLGKPHTQNDALAKNLWDWMESELKDEKIDL